ncbi:MAG: response regulator [Nanobdellota archaeon]
MTEEITVNMGRLYVVDKPALLTCLGLGSCIGLMIYDESKGVSGLAHIMLPDSNNARFVPHEQSSLLAETDEYSLKTMKNSLMRMGYEIKDIVKNEKDLLDKFKELDPYVCLLDFHLSENNLNDVINELLKLNNTANIVVANTDENSDYLDLLRDGVLDVITRPLTKQKIALSLDLVDSLRHLRFADIAIEKMLKKMYAMGCKNENLKAKLVGGGNMFTHSQVTIRNIGKENTQKVLDALHERKISVVSKEVGGNVGRTVRFDTTSYNAEIITRDGKKTI